MDWLGFSAAVAVAIITFIGGYITARRKRKDELQDRKDNTVSRLDSIDKKLDTDKVRLDAHEKQLAALAGEQEQMSSSLSDLCKGQVVMIRATMSLLDGENTEEAKHDINDFLTGKIGGRN